MVVGVWCCVSCCGLTVVVGLLVCGVGLCLLVGLFVGVSWLLMLLVYFNVVCVMCWGVLVFGLFPGVGFVVLLCL